MSELFEIAALGTLTFQRGGLLITEFPTRKAEALLVYLACTGQSQSRELLAEMFWSEHDQTHAAANLRMALTGLRRQVEPYLLTTHDTIAINPDSAWWLDVREMEAYLAAVEPQWGQTGTLTPIHAAQLEKALALYRDEFLKNFSLRDSPDFEQWALIERERLRRQVAEALRRLVLWHITCRAYRSGIQRASRLLQIDPLAEDAHRHMMLLLALTGQRHEALAQYQTCRERLAAELGVAPDTETIALYERIQQGQVAPNASTSEISAPVDVTGTPPNPYKGLRPFQESDASDFFGREGLIKTLLAHLDTNGSGATFLAVVGPSGSGKSSVVRAGLIPLLRQGKVHGSKRWHIAEMFPAAHPLEELEIALLRALSRRSNGLIEQLRCDARGLIRAVKLMLTDSDSQVLLFIDQFEEVFTLVEDEAERSHFLDSLFTAAVEPHSPLRIVITLRADCYDRPLRYPNFGELLRQQTQVVLPLTPEDLEQAIVGPAERVGIIVEPKLVTQIVTDAHDQVGSLPLLEYTLTELFERCKGGPLTLDVYHAIGGISNALTYRADELYHGLDSESQGIARQLLLRLVSLGNHTEDTRRRVPRQELLSLGKRPQVVETVLDHFAQYRLLTLDKDDATSDPTVEVAHEALLRSWERLRDWINHRRDDLRIQQRLTAATQEWLNAERDPGFLASGARLTQFEVWQQTTDLGLNQTEHDYLITSLAERKRQADLEHERQARELTLQRRAANSLRYLVVVLIVCLILAAGLSIFAFASRGEAIQNYTRAEAQRLAVEANRLLLAHDNVEITALLAIRSLRTQYSFQGDEALAGTSALDYPRQMFVGHKSWLTGITFSPDGKYLLTSSNDQTARLWDVQTGLTLREFVAGTDGSWSMTSAAFSPDGHTIITGGSDKTARLWNPQSGQEIRQITGHSASVTSVMFSPNGKWILTGSEDATARLWDAQTGQQIRQFIGHTGAVMSAVFSPDGSYILTGSSDKTARLWNTETGRELRQFIGHSSFIASVAISPDSKYVLTGGQSAEVRLWNMQTGQQVRQFSFTAPRVASVAFSPDGQYALTGADDRTARLWDMQTGAEVRRFIGQRGQLNSVAFSPDGKFIATGSGDGTARIWDTQGSQDVRQFVGHTNRIQGAIFSPNGKYVLTTSNDQTARLWDVQTQQEVRRFVGHNDCVTGLAFSADSKYVLTGSCDKTVRLWDMESGKELRQFVGHTAMVQGVAFSPDGKTAVSGSYDLTVRVWDVQTGKELHILTGHTNLIVHGVAFSPDGKTILSGALDKTVRLWDTQTGQPLRVITIPNSIGVGSVAFSPDGKTILSGDLNGTVYLWDAVTGQELYRYLGHTNVVWTVAYSADGKTILSGSADNTARLWDRQTGLELRRFSSPTYTFNSASFSPDSRLILTAAGNITARLWDTDYQTTIRSLCSRLQRDFSDDERAQYGIKDSQPTCS